MANLVCWASGLLEILPDKDTPMDSGPVVLVHGTATKLRGLMTVHGQQLDRGGVKGWFVPGTKPVPADPEEAAAVQRDNMKLVIEFNKKLHGAEADGA